jgi:threonine dehydrogenase-like Zn-dependent dehydrogenase
MKAVFWDGKPLHVSIRETPRARLMQPTDAVVRVTSTAICGLDLHTYHGLFGSKTPPWALGHEAMGYVTEVGDSVSTLQVGDRVVIPDSPAEGHLDGSLLPEIDVFGFGPDFGNIGGCQGTT